MIKMKGFKHKEDAEKFIKQNRKGVLTSKNIRCYLYDAARVLYEFNTNEYKYCVCWVEE